MTDRLPSGMLGVMNTKRRRMLSVMAALLAVSAFFILSSIAVVWANGLRFNPETKRFEQTVVIAVESDKTIGGVEVFLDGELVAAEVPFQLRGLLPGQYELLVQRPGFQSFSQVLNLSAGEVGVVREFQFIALLPQVTIDENRVVFAEPAFEAGLRVTSDGELLDNNRLITRFIDDPLSVRRLRTGYVYQLGKELRYFWPAGPHDYPIYTLENEEVAKMNIRPGAWEIVIQEGETVRVISLGVPSS